MIPQSPVHFLNSLSPLALSRLKALSTPETVDAAGANAISPSKSIATVPSNLPRPGTDQKFLKLPVESARKLRFYDRSDLSELIKQHAVDKAVLEAANAALCQVAADSTTHLHDARIPSLCAPQLGLTGGHLFQAQNICLRMQSLHQGAVVLRRLTRYSRAACSS